MSRHYKYICILLLGIVPMVHHASAQINEAQIQTIEDSIRISSTSEIPPRTIDAEDWRKLTNDSAYSYRNRIEAEVKPRNPSDFELWMKKAAKDLFSFFFSTVGQVLFWLLIAGILAFVLLKIFKGDIQFMFGRKERLTENNADIEMSTEDVTNADWESKISLALSQGNKRLATRYLFVHALQLLHQHQHILYSIDKTNFDYYRMINNEDVKALYRQLMVRFEYVWFGKAEVNEEQWKDMGQMFEHLKSKL